MKIIHSSCWQHHVLLSVCVLLQQRFCQGNPARKAKQWPREEFLWKQERCCYWGIPSSWLHPKLEWFILHWAKSRSLEVLKSSRFWLIIDTFSVEGIEFASFQRLNCKINQMVCSFWPEMGTTKTEENKGARSHLFYGMFLISFNAVWINQSNLSKWCNYWLKIFHCRIQPEEK